MVNKLTMALLISIFTVVIIAFIMFAAFNFSVEEIVASFGSVIGRFG